MLGCEAEDRVLGLRVKNEAGRVCLWIAADDEDLVPHLGERRKRVLGGGRLADAPLSVECDLSQSHACLLRRRNSRPAGKADRTPFSPVIETPNERRRYRGAGLLLILGGRSIWQILTRSPL